MVNICQKGEFSQTVSRPKCTISRPLKSPNSFELPPSDSDNKLYSSNGASPNPVKHELEMINKKPNIKRLLREVDENTTCS